MKNKLLLMTKLLLIILFVGMIVNIPHTQAASGGKVTQKNYSLTPSGALYINADKGKEPVVTQLDQTLIIAIENCDFDYVQTCLNQGANPNVVWNRSGGPWSSWISPIEAATNIKNTDARVKLIDLLIERGANPVGYEFHNANGNITCLYYIFNCSIDSIPYWLNNGVPANLTIDHPYYDKNYSLINRILSTPPHQTSDSYLEKQKELIQLLVNNGADINSQYYNSTMNEYLTPLMQVIVNKPYHDWIISDDEYSWENIDRRNLELFQFLIDLGADVRIRNKNGMSAKDLAVKFGRLDMIKILTSIVPFAESFTMSEMSIGGITIGSDLSDVEKLYGKPTKIDKGTSKSSDGKCTLNWIHYSYNDQLITSAEGLEDGRTSVFGVYSLSENFSTPKGLKIGMSLSEATELYQMQPERNKKFDKPGWACYSLTPLDKEDNFHYGLFLHIDQNNIIKMLHIGLLGF